AVPAVVDFREMHRAADDPAKIVDGGIDESASARVGEPVVRVQRVVAAKVIAHAVKLVGPAFGDHVDDRAAGVAEFRAEVVRLNLELLDHVDGGIKFYFCNAAVLL